LRAATDLARLWRDQGKRDEVNAVRLQAVVLPRNAVQRQNAVALQGAAQQRNAALRQNAVVA
jgi:hypothetical protein